MGGMIYLKANKFIIPEFFGVMNSIIQIICEILKKYTNEKIFACCIAYQLVSQRQVFGYIIRLLPFRKYLCKNMDAKKYAVQDIS